MTAKQTAEKALEMLHELKDLCYSDKSNEVFDQLHDDIYWQCVGLSMSMDECETDDDYESILHEFIDALEMAKKIKAYHKSVTSTPAIDWMYA
jgi:hypothetical protein